VLACSVASILTGGCVQVCRADAYVDQARLRAANAEPQNWFTLGRDGNQSYFSPLTKINEANVGRLGFAWSYVMSTTRAQEATPIVVDGVMYTSGSWGYVYAVDAATGKEKWTFDPHADPRAARNPCCDLINRGVAVWRGKVFVASIDGVLHALDAASGQERWKADTIVDRSQSYSSTGAVYIAGNLAVIGNSGSDMDHGGVRGYVSAYDVDSGALQWRFYTVPGEHGKPYENSELAMADRTWPADRGPQIKGGGTVWDGITYDADLDLVYFGTANAAPYHLDAAGPADALFTAAIVALHAKTGRMAWYYQTTPGDHWDYDATQKLILADLRVGARLRHVLMQANKNGFFYVLDRESGELLSAKNFSYVNWASGIDMKTGRPTLTPQSDWYSQPKNIAPSWAGGHSWPPMSYDARTGLTYIPTIDAAAVWVDMVRNGAEVQYMNGAFTGDAFITDDRYDPEAMRSRYGELPSRESVQAGRHGKLVRELLRAWDPVAQRIVWEQETSSGTRGYDGGVMSTAGDLVFQGRGSGELWVYAADSGKVLKVIPTGSHIMAAPMTYEAGGVQYVAVQVGYGGTMLAIPRTSAAVKYQNVNRIIAFRLDGGVTPLPQLRMPIEFPRPPDSVGDAAQIHRGEAKFMEQCARCHPFHLSVTLDLRTLPPDLHAAFNDIVLGGRAAALGMESFADLLTADDVDAIHAYLIDQGHRAYDAQQRERRAH
jgi:quinohemoprotein ethanol dehydrogenase